MLDRREQVRLLAAPAGLREIEGVAYPDARAVRPPGERLPLAEEPLRPQSRDPVRLRLIREVFAPRKDGAKAEVFIWILRLVDVGEAGDEVQRQLVIIIERRDPRRVTADTL